MNKCEICAEPAHYRYVDDAKKVHWYCSLWCANGKPEPKCCICGKSFGPYRFVAGKYYCSLCASEEDRMWEKVMLGQCPMGDPLNRICTLARCPPGCENGHCSLTIRHPCHGCIHWKGQYDEPFQTYTCYSGSFDHCYNKEGFLIVRR